MLKHPILEAGIGFSLQTLELPLQVICVRRFQFVEAIDEFSKAARRLYPISMRRPLRG